MQRILNFEQIKDLENAIDNYSVFFKNMEDHLEVATYSGKVSNWIYSFNIELARWVPSKHMGSLWLIPEDDIGEISYDLRLGYKYYVRRKK